MELKLPALTPQQWTRVAFVLLIVALIVPLGVRSLISVNEAGPIVQIIAVDGTVNELSLAQMRSGHVITRQGRYQNQFGNWRDEGVYSGVLLSELLPPGEYAFVEAVADDGYCLQLERGWIEDPAFPLVLAFAFNGVTVPDWEDGFRIAVLPKSGEVSNADYGTASAGSIWVKQVVQLVVLP
jgi:hypothetical protein